MTEPEPLHIVRIESGRHPFQAYLMSLFFVSGLSYFVYQLAGEDSTPRSINDTLPLWLVIAWSSLLMIGPGLVMLGSVWKSRTLSQLVTGLILQKRGLFISGIATIIYTIVVLVYTYRQGTLIQATFIALILFGFSFAAFVRQSHINRDLKEIATLGTKNNGHSTNRVTVPPEGGS